MVEIVFNFSRAELDLCGNGYFEAFLDIRPNWSRLIIRNRDDFPNSNASREIESEQEFGRAIFLPLGANTRPDLRDFKPGGVIYNMVQPIYSGWHHCGDFSELDSAAEIAYHELREYLANYSLQSA